ncbi:hypothetical protein DRI50_05350 [candidate division KSB1 bacterium]|jgi:phospholipid/cholesterol/gamma-HCH transport system permease protein|nr:MAG: hypothetical protein DRI50_05350 [candidate division KSB1 bacterium]
MVKKQIQIIGRATIRYFEGLGSLTILFFRSVFALRKIFKYTDQIVDGFLYIGRFSMPIIVITSIFMGLVLGVQIGTQISPETPRWVEGGLILRAVLLEMGPIVTGLILSGRVGSGIASEIGEMKVTEQIDAFRTTGIDPIEFLVMPRLVAGLITIPILVVYADAITVLFGFISSYFTINLTWTGFVKGMRHVFVATDLYTSVIKGFIYGMVITTFGCYFGLHAQHGARGVGRSTTHAVIWSSIVILILDYIISAILFFIW